MAAKKKTSSGASDKAKKAESRRMNAQAAKTKLGAISNKADGRFASPSVNKQARYVNKVQESMYPGSEWRGYIPVKPGRADAKPSPKKQSSIKKK